VGRPHGLDGSFRVVGARSALLRPGVALTIAERNYEVARVSGHDARPVARLEGVDDRTAAESLHGEDLLVAREDVPPLEPGEWWAEDLVGCDVTDGGRAVGVVRRLVALPSCEALEIERPAGGELLVPMVADAVRAVDVDARRIDVRLAFVEPDEAG
jgi:16S rRNA processing protein RimM